MMAQRAGGTSIIMDRFDAERSLQLIEQYKPTHSQMGTDHVCAHAQTARSHSESSTTSPALEVAIHAAAPCPVPVKQEMIEWWGPILYEYYAGTEGNGSTSIDSHDWLKHPGSVGRPMGVEVHIPR